MNTVNGFFLKGKNWVKVFSSAAAGCLFLSIPPSTHAEINTAFTPAEPDTPLTAKWIWAPRSDSVTPAYHEYNETICLSRQFSVGEFTQAIFRISADSWYRLKVNDVWVADGPSRAWPEHYQYDVLDVSSYLKPNSQNLISITAKYFGIGTFHTLPQQAGVLGQLDLDGKTVLKTDGSWIAAEMPQWIPNTPKMYIQMEGNEWYDARLEQTGSVNCAVELYDTHEGPWQGLNPRDVGLLTRVPVFLKRYLGAQIVRAEWLDYCFRPTDLNFPALIEANNATSMAGGIVTILENKEPCEIHLQDLDLKVSLDGKEGVGKIKLEPGQHLLCAFTRNPSHHLREKNLRFINNTNSFKLINPLESSYENPWSYVHFPECYYATNDYSRSPIVGERNAIYSQKRDELLKIKTPDEFLKTAGDRLKNYPSQKMFLKDSFWEFANKQVIGPADENLIKNPSALIYDNAIATTIYPDSRGDVELLYDLGVQSCGYYTFRLKAPAGTILDINQIEYIRPDGKIQGTGYYRNTMRYITKEGVNEMISIKRRSGRYIFLTLREMTGPVEIQNFHVIESTYPVEYKGDFQCSDTRLSEIWDISARTLKLCMEDTFTDCPLYEQTHWVGDARNESLFAYGVFGAEDIARRCIDITAKSLNHYPFAGSQTPSCWDTLIPVWSFMWGLSIWDYYWQTGDEDFIREYLPYAIRNIRGAAQYMKDGLFSGPFWNMFDWSGADQGHNTVIHNSMFMIGAIDAALRLSAVIGGTPDDEWMKETREKLAENINKLWDENKKSYPDAIHSNGKISPSICQHTSILSLIFDIIEPQNREAAIANIINPPAGMVKLGSPFAALYMYEALEKTGNQDTILKQIYENYMPMLEIGSTTVWESFPGGTSGAAFPTRSHCHAWSSAPCLFLPRIILGVVPTAPAAAEVTLSPRPYDLKWANGRVAVHEGVIDVRWQIQDKNLTITCKTPKSTQLKFQMNPQLEQFESITLNGEKVK